MAKQKSFTDILFRDFTRGLGRQGGFRTWKGVEKAVAKRVIDPNSKFRKKMNSLSITSTVKGSLTKMYEIMDLFFEEYQLEKTLLQKSWYAKSDVQKIDRKLLHIKHLIKKSEEQEDYDLCVNFWNNIKRELYVK